MPSFAHLSDAERTAIAGYLFGEDTQVEIITELTPAENGRNVFVANCARCHKASPGDPQPPDQRKWGMQPAILGGITAQYKPDEFKAILDAGPCYMPSFDFLTEKDKEDVYSYLDTFEPAYTSNMRRGCGMRGRMGMRGRRGCMR